MEPKVSMFPLPDPEAPPPPPPTRREDARVLRPERTQIRWVLTDLDATLPLDHPARGIWDALERMDLSAFYAAIKATTHTRGRPTADPQLLLGLWLLAIAEGVGSARQVARLCETHDAFRWMCGGVSVNYHLLSDFRASQGAALDDLLTQIVASLMTAGVVTLERVAQDGMRVRASAGAGSFRREERLERCLQEAKEQVERLAHEREHPDPGVSRRERAARERAARVEAALAYLPEAQAAKARQEQSLAKAKRGKAPAPRVSTTDPEARVMKTPSGGFRPGYNVQYATDVESGVVVGAGATSEGTDARQAAPMLEQVVERTGSAPEAYLVDGGFATRETITTLAQRGCTVYAPVRLPRNRPEAERYAPRAGDSPEVAAWRERMATEEAKAIYRERAASAEWANAHFRRRGMRQFLVRGMRKVTAVGVLAAVAHNVLHWGFMLG
jgi:transposase